MTFKCELPKYQVRQMVIMPLDPLHNRPLIGGWPAYSMHPPGQEEMARWSKDHGKAGLGLVLGPSSGVAAVSIATADRRVQEALDGLLPVSPWQCNSGETTVGLYGFSENRTTIIKDKAGKHIVKVLAAGAFIPLPPSIDPISGQACEATCDLHELDKGLFPTLSPDIEGEILGALGAAGIEATSAFAERARTAPPPDPNLDWHADRKAADIAWNVVRGETCLVDGIEEAVDFARASGTDSDADLENAILRMLVEHMELEVLQDRTFALPIGWDAGLSEETRQRLSLKFGPEDLAQDRRQIMDRFLENLRTDPDPLSETHQNAIDAALMDIVRNKWLKGSEIDLILREIKAISGVTLAELREKLKLFSKPGKGRDNQTDITRGVIKIIERHGPLRFDCSKFSQWSGKCWQELEDDRIGVVIARRFGHLKTAWKQYEHRQIQRLCATLSGRSLKGPSAPAGINFANGFLSEDGELTPHCPDHGLTYALPYSYCPETSAEMPMFNQFLLDCWGQDADCAEKIMALQEAMGATFMGMGTRFQRAILLYGRAGSGKSRIPALIQALLPPGTTSAIKPSQFGDKFLPAQLAGKIFNFAGELSESRKIPGDIFKQIIAGDPMKVQNKHQAPFTLVPKATHWFGSNFLPISNDGSEGFSRRWLVLEFNEKVPESMRIPDFQQKIIENEAHAIVAWAFEGYKRLCGQERQYTLPPSHQNALNNMIRQVNPAKYYLMLSGSVDTGDKASGAVTDVKEVWEDYKNYCKGRGIRRRLSMPEFVEELKNASADCGMHVREIGGKTVVHGLRIRY